MSDRLFDYFRGIATKRLSAVEADSLRSNQHEFDGVHSLRRMLGTERKIYPATFVRMEDLEEEVISCEGTLTWYDSRENQPKRSAEFRLYYSIPDSGSYFREGEFVVFAITHDERFLVISAPSSGTSERQMLWLFEHSPDEPQTSLDYSDGSPELSFPRRLILEWLGVEAFEEEPSLLDEVLRRFPDGFPTTLEFSRVCRDLSGAEAADDADMVVLLWMELEERLFKTLERHLILDRIQQGFGEVEEFLQFSLSVHNRRKARAGKALENHIEEILRTRKFKFVRNGRTELRSTPDFLFPGVAEYRDASFPDDSLSMLGVKASCKERWRQVLAEANRIENKHLLTLEPSISGSQTEEMRSNKLQLVVPASIHQTYSPSQQDWLWSVEDFLAMISAKQA